MIHRAANRTRRPPSRGRRRTRPAESSPARYSERGEIIELRGCGTRARPGAETAAGSTLSLPVHPHEGARSTPTLRSLAISSPPTLPRPAAVGWHGVPVDEARAGAGCRERGDGRSAAEGHRGFLRSRLPPPRLPERRRRRTNAPPAARCVKLSHPARTCRRRIRARGAMLASSPGASHEKTRGRCRRRLGAARRRRMWSVRPTTKRCWMRGVALAEPHRTRVGVPPADFEKNCHGPLPRLTCSPTLDGGATEAVPSESSPRTKWLRGGRELRPRAADAGQGGGGRNRRT